MSGKKTWIAVANVCSCLGVIILHANGVFWSFPTGRLWYTANFLETFFYWPVPVFFMISGATLINYRERYSTKTFFIKRIRKTVLPFIVWSIFSVFFRYLYEGWKVDSVKDTLSGLLNSKYMPVYWFFMPLFAVYLSLPLLSATSKNIRIKVFSYVCFVSFIFISVLPTVFLLLGLQYNSTIQIPVAGGYILYVILGYIVDNVELKRNHRFILYLLAIIGWFIHFEGTNILSLSKGELVSTFKGYLNFPAVMQAVGIFVFFKYVKWNKIGNNFEKIIFFLSKYTFGIYLIHMYFVLSLPNLLKLNSSSFCWRTIGSVFIFAISSVICYLISCIPIIRRCIGV